MTTLHRQDPTANCFRFWGVEVGPDLFGTWCVTRRWGRIGTGGQSRIASHESQASARASAERLEAAKRRRGYRGA